MHHAARDVDVSNLDSFFFVSFSQISSMSRSSTSKAVFSMRKVESLNQQLVLLDISVFYLVPSICSFIRYSTDRPTDSFRVHRPVSNCISAVPFINTAFAENVGFVSRLPRVHTSGKARPLCSWCICASSASLTVCVKCSRPQPSPPHRYIQIRLANHASPMTSLALLAVTHCGPAPTKRERKGAY